MKQARVFLYMLCAFVIFALGFLFGIQDTQSRCVLCGQELLEDEIYLWDTRSGAIFPLSSYTNSGQYPAWLDDVNHMLQEKQNAAAGVARFPESPSLTPAYCNIHAPASGEERFMILQSRHKILTFFSLRDGLFFNGYYFTLHYNETQNCWEVTVSS